MFKINNEEWRVVLVDPLHPSLCRTDGSMSIGSCDDITGKIYISKNLPSSLLKRVLCHEIVHAAMFSYNVELKYEEEELLADLVATYGEEIINITN